jgi:hypothetical protein
MVDTVARVAASLNKTDRLPYDAAISGLKGGGCKAAGYRLAAADGGDFPMCCRHLANDWRMDALFAKDHSVIMISLARHDKSHNPARGPRRRLPWSQPGWTPQAREAPCCDDPDRPPTMLADLSEHRAGMFSYS